jgi:hypothetical protein
VTESHVYRLTSGAVLVVDPEALVAEWRRGDEALTPRQLLRAATPELRQDVGRAARRAVAEIRVLAATAEETTRAEALRLLAARLWEAHRAALAEPPRRDEQQALPGL